MAKYWINCIFLSLLCLPSVLTAADEAIVEAVVQSLEDKHDEKMITESEKVTERPNQWLGATEVFFLGFIIDIDSIDDANQNFDANIFINLTWQDQRLANPNSKTRQMKLSEVWNPRLIVTNQQGRIHAALPQVVQVEADGTVIYRQRYTGKFSQPLRLDQFPMDTHTFEIRFAAAGFNTSDLKFVPNPKMIGLDSPIAEVISLPNWMVSDVKVEKSTYMPVPTISVPGFIIKFEATRLFAYYLWQIIFPLSVVIVMSWGAFWVNNDQIGVRIGIATSSVLTLIAHRFVLASLLPKLPYMTRLDYFAVTSTFMVLLALILVVLTSWVVKGKDSILANKIDAYSRVLFPIGFIILITWLVFV